MADPFNTIIAPPKDFQLRGFPIPESDVIFQPFSGVPDKYTQALIYCASSLSNGVLQANSATVYIGRIRRFLSEVRATGEENYPIVYAGQPGEVFRLADLYVRGTAGDGIAVFYYL